MGACSAADRGGDLGGSEPAESEQIFAKPFPDPGFYQNSLRIAGLSVVSARYLHILSQEIGLYGLGSKFRCYLFLLSFRGLGFAGLVVLAV